jgi:hypothetical protein
MVFDIIIKGISQSKRCNFEMPIICAPPYSEEIKSWSMYTIVDSKWQIEPPPPYTTNKSLLKYKKHIRCIYREFKKMIISSQNERERNMEQILQEAQYVTQEALTRRREARQYYEMK